jgi:hypothetical protein
MAAPKRKTRAQLEADLADTAACLTTMREERNAAAYHAEELRKKLDEVKERLAFAERENQRMRGYLERVQEDDVVREELIATGEPDGGQRLVPKRKPTIFAPQMCTSAPEDAHGIINRAAEWSGRSNPRPRPKPRDWVTY